MTCRGWMRRISGIICQPDKLEFLRSIVKPLMRTISACDFKAMRFEKDIVEVSPAIFWQEKEKYETLKESIIEEIRELPLSVNIVAKEEDTDQAEPDKSILGHHH